MSEEKDKKIYELALLLKSEDDLTYALTLLRQHHGEPTSEPRARRIALAYPIKGNTETVFTSCTFRASGEDVKNLEHDLRARQTVIRFMILIAPPPSERPAAPPSFPSAKRERPAGALRASAMSESKSAAPRPLSNEALTKKIEEILQ